MADPLPRESDFEVIEVDYKTYGSLVRLDPQLCQEHFQPRSILLNGSLVRKAVHDDRLVSDQPTALVIIAPNTSNLPGGRPTQVHSEPLQSTLNPQLLINWITAPIHARDEQNQQSEFDLTEPKLIGSIRHLNLPVIKTTMCILS